VPEWKFDESPLRLRSVHGTRIEVDHGGDALEIDPALLDLRDDADRQKEEEEIFRTEDPEPGVGAMLRSQGESLGELRSERTGLGPAGLERIDRWVAGKGPADHLTVFLDSAALTRTELGRLGRLADRRGLEIEVRLRGDG
jgi:hypothetical protein